MKIIQLIHGLTTGGAEALVKDYALEFNNNHDVMILCLWNHKDSPNSNILKKNNIKVIYASDYLKFKGSNIIYKLINKIHMFIIVKRILHEENPDILHTHLAVNSFVRFAKINKKVKLFHTVHNEPQIIWNNNLKRKIDFICCKYLVKHNNMRFIVLHKEMQKEVNKLFNLNNSIVLNNGIDYNRFNKNKTKDKKTLIKELNIPNNSFIVGHIGRFNYQKNHVFLVDIFHKISLKKDNAFLLMIGSGEEMSTIKEKLNSLKLQNKYLILSNRSDIPDLLNIMDCMVFPSIFEGLPVTLVEAQKMGVLCFASDKITKDVNISNLIVNISLSKTDNEWADEIINYKKKTKVSLDAKDWDMKNVVKKLERIYLGKI